MDTHTAVAYTVKNKYVDETNDDKPALIVSTASPFKFPRSICNALGIDVKDVDDFEDLNRLSQATGEKIPVNLASLEKAEVLHDDVWDRTEMKQALVSFLNK